MVQSRAVVAPMLAALITLAVAAPPAVARTVDLTAKANGSRVVVHRGDNVVIRLAANASTGYRWSTSHAPDRAIVRLVSSRYVASASEPGVVGAGGRQVVRLTATGKGRTRLALAYLSPGTPHTVGRRFRVSFTVR